MTTLSPPDVAHRPVSRKAWQIFGVVVVVLAVTGLAAWSIVEMSQPTQLDIATDLADQWIAGWNASDPEAVAAVFAEDVREHYLSQAEARVFGYANVARTSDVTETDEGTFLFDVEGDWSGERFATRFEIVLDGDHAVSIEENWRAPWLSD